MMSHILKSVLVTFLEYFKQKGLSDQANVMKTVFESEAKAKYLNNVLQGKKNPENTISLDEACAFEVYLGLTKRTYGYIKKFTDERGLHFLPCHDYLKPQKDKCVASDFKVTDDTITASVKATAYNYLERLLQIEDVKESVERLEEEYGKNVVEYEFGDKAGWDGSCQPKHNVSISYILFLNEASVYIPALY